MNAEHTPPPPAADALAVEMPTDLGQVVGPGAITLGVVIDDHLAAVVLRPVDDPDDSVVVRLDDHDAEYLVRALAGTLRYLNQGPGCPACTHRWAD